MDLQKHLSIHELLNRQGKPVWIQMIDHQKGYTGWAIFHSISKGGAFMQFNAGCNSLYTSDYERTWVAYDHEPQQSRRAYDKPDIQFISNDTGLHIDKAATVRLESDYAPGTFLYITCTSDGDIALRITGNGEMRIATSGGQFHGLDLVAITSAFRDIITLLIRKSKEET